MSIWHWIIVLLYLGAIAVFFVAAVRILHRLRYSGWWSLLALIPLLNVIGLWKLSKARWPIESR